MSDNDETSGLTVQEVTSGPFAAQTPTKRVGDFDCQRLIGRGGMAEVWLAKKRGPQGFAKTVALKLMKLSAEGHEESARSLFVDEARITGSLRHPHLVEVYDFGEEPDGTYWISMEYVNGWTLDRIVSVINRLNGQIPLRVLLDLFLQVADGLDYAHDATDDDGVPHNIVHRDIKPENIIVSRKGKAKLMDFGIAKATSNTHQTADANTARGTVLYMSPEQATGKPLDRRSDIFALGSTMFTALMGGPPFAGASIPEIMINIAAGERDLAIEALSDHEGGFLDIFMKCTENDRDDRYETVGELRGDLFSLMTRCAGGMDLAMWMKQNEKLLSDPESSEALATGTESMIFLPASDISELAIGADVPPDQATRAQLNPRTPHKRRRKKRKKKQKLSPAIAFAIASILLLGVGVIAVLAATRTTPEPVAAQDTEPPEVQMEVRQVEEPVLEATTTPEPPTPEPRVELPTPTPRVERPTPAVREASPRIEKPTPAPVIPTAEPGFITLTARPYAEIEIDGVARGNTPRQKLELPSGMHSIVFICVSCSPELRETREVDIQPGTNPNIHVRFNQ